VRCRSFAFDLGLLEEYWIGRRYHHTISTPLVYALATALEEVEREGLERRWRRHERVHGELAARLGAGGLTLLPPPSERLWNLSAVVVPDGVDDAAVRRDLLQRHGIEIGAGLGPLAGKIWRIGLMGSGATSDNVDRVVTALADALKLRGVMS
jgi:alanine-glyoxylate transaminase/serine-glyoxylate transaminase/serine-pyruvate transaminase